MAKPPRSAPAKTSIAAARRVTAKDVAKLAGVSTATVSLVVSAKDSGRVSEATKRRVLKAVQSLDYRVDTNARSLATGISPWISLVVGNLNNPYFSAITMGAYESFGQDYQLLLSLSNPRALDNPLEALNSLPGQVQGLLTESWALPQILQSGISSHIVALDWQDKKTPPVSTVGFDLEPGINHLAAHLTDLGHRKFVYIDADITNPSFEQRRTLLKERLDRTSKSKITFRRERCMITLDSSAALMRKRYQTWQREGFTAVVCAADIQAFGMIGEAPRLGLSIPGDFSVTGFDDLPLSNVISPNLTTVRLSGRDLGFEAANVMKAMIANPEGGTMHVKLPSNLIVRSSTDRI